jgi:hypothetical protein
MEYTDHKKYDNPLVDGYILLAPVSDREAASTLTPSNELEQSIKVAEGMIKQGHDQETMPGGSIPPIFASPITAYRWYSLAAKGYVITLQPHVHGCEFVKNEALLSVSYRGDDDYFSSDLSDERISTTFGRIDKPVMFLPCGDDQMVPPSVDREELLARWIGACAPGLASKLSGFVPGADHIVSKPEAWKWLADTVVKFLETLE